MDIALLNTQIEHRISVRSYKSDPLSDDDRQKLSSFIEELPKGPWGGTVRIALIDIETAKAQGLKLGTYGIIKGASSFLACAVQGGALPRCDCGYVMAYLVLAATSLGLGTCFMAGSYTPTSFAKAIDLKSDEELPIVSPIGYPTGNRHFIERVMGLFSKPRSRKPFEELFTNKAGQPLTADAASDWKHPLEAVRLAPSALNGQPWRIQQKEDHFAFTLTSKANKAFSPIDLGIALAHFEIASLAAGLPGHIQVDASSPLTPIWKL